MGGRSSKQINPIGQDEDINIVNSSAPTSGLCPTSIESQKDLEKLEEVNEQGDPKTPERRSFCQTLCSSIVSVTCVLLVVYIFWVHSSKSSIIDSLSGEIETQRTDFVHKVAMFEEQSAEFAKEIQDFESQIKAYEAEMKYRGAKHGKSMENAQAEAKKFKAEAEKFKVKMGATQDKVSLLENSLAKSSARLAQFELKHQEKLDKMGETKEALMRDVEDLKMLNRALVAQITELTEANTKLSDDKINLTVINSKITDYNAKLDKDYNEMVFEKDMLADQIATLEKQVEQLQQQQQQQQAAEEKATTAPESVGELELDEPEIEDSEFDDSESDYPDFETTEDSLLDLFRSPQPDEEATEKNR